MTAASLLDHLKDWTEQAAEGAEATIVIVPIIFAVWLLGLPIVVGYWGWRRLHA